MPGLAMCPRLCRNWAWCSSSGISPAAQHCGSRLSFSFWRPLPWLCNHTSLQYWFEFVTGVAPTLKSMSIVCMICRIYFNPSDPTVSKVKCIWSPSSAVSESLFPVSDNKDFFFLLTGLKAVWGSSSLYLHLKAGCWRNCLRGADIVIGPRFKEQKVITSGNHTFRELTLPGFSCSLASCHVAFVKNTVT